MMAQHCIFPSKPVCMDIVKSQGGQRTGCAVSTVHAHPKLLTTDNPNPPKFNEGGSFFSGTGHNLAPTPRPLKHTTRWLYASKCRLFADG